MNSYNMKICPINPFNTYNYTSNRCVDKNKTLLNFNTAASSVIVNKPDSVSFSASWVSGADALRALLPYKIPDLYSEVILLAPDTLKSGLRKDVFSGKLKSVVRFLSLNRGSLFPTEAEFFTMLKSQMKKTPHMNLDSYMQSILPEYHTKLLNTQMRVFNKMNSFAQAMPADLLEQYNYLLYITNQELSNKHILLPFNAQEFKYKLHKIENRINYSGIGEEIIAIRKLSSIAEIIPNIPKEVRMDKKFNQKKYENTQKLMIKKFRNYMDKSVLKKDRELLNLLNMAENRIYKCPSIIPFNSKNFIYEIKNITVNLKDKKLAHLIEKEASSLPTSKNDLSSFIVKEASRSSEQIVFDMLAGSVGSVDHIVALHRGGKESLYNYALTSSYMNAVKAHMSLDKFIHKYPQIHKTASAQIKRLETLANTGVFDRIGLDKNYITNLKYKLNKVSVL